MPFALRYSALFRKKVLCYKANYILYFFFTEITRGVRTFGGSQSVCIQELVLVDWPRASKLKDHK